MSVVPITRAFGTNNAVLVFFISFTDITGMEIWQRGSTINANRSVSEICPKFPVCSFSLAYLDIFAKDFGVEADPVLRDEHFALIQHVSLQGAGITWWQTRIQFPK